MNKEIKCCEDCAYYRALIFKDNWSEAFCGKCTNAGGATKRMRATKNAFSKACDSFVEAGHGKKETNP